MDRTLREDADAIIASSLKAVLPDEAVRRALAQFRPGRGRVLLVAAGKAAWQMTHAAVEALSRVDGGVVVTKYGHVKGEIPGVICCEAGHPVPDENGFAATEKALELVHVAGKVGLSFHPVAAQGAHGQRVGARGTAQPQVNAARVQLGQCAEGLGHHQRRVVGQHHPA